MQALSDIDKLFVNSISKLYLKNGFGRILKKEIDIVLFDFFCAKILSSYKNTMFFVEKNLVNYIILDKKEIHEIALKLKITDKQTISYIQKTYLFNFEKYKDELDKMFFLALKRTLKKHINSKEDFYNGKIKIYAYNQIFKDELEARLDKIGAIIDYASNKSVLIIDIHWLLKLFGITKKADIVDIFTSLIKRSTILEKDKQKLITSLNKKSIKDIFKYVLRDILEKLSGKGISFVLDIIFEKLQFD